MNEASLQEDDNKVSYMKLELPKNLIEKIPGAEAFAGFLRKIQGPPKEPASEISLACDFGASKIVFLETERSGGKFLLSKFQKLHRIDDKKKDSEILRQAFEAGNYRTNKVRISVKGQGVILRFIQFPKMKPEELRGAISYEVEQYIPFKAADVVWDIHVLDDNVPLAAGGMGMNILLAVLKREDLNKTLEIFQGAGLQVEIIDCDALASINAVEHFSPQKFLESCAVLDIGTEISTLSVVVGGKPRFIRDISYGGVDMVKKLKRKLGLTNEQALEQIEVDRQPSPEAQEIIKQALVDLVSELKLSVNYYLDQVAGAEPIKNFFICGGGGYHPLVLETLTRDLGASAEMLDILKGVELAPGLSPEVIKSNQGLLPVSIGLCLRD